MASDPSQERGEQGGEALALRKMQALLDCRPFPSFGFTAPEPGAPGFQQEMWVAGLYGWRFISGGLPGLLVGQVNE